MSNAVANHVPSDLDITGNGTAWRIFRGQGATPELLTVPHYVNPADELVAPRVAA
jgi:hypothetical protein